MSDEAKNIVAHGAEQTAKAEKLAKNLADFANGTYEPEIEELINILLYKTHRTLQQSIFGLFLKYTFKLAETEHFDARNEYAREVAQAIKQALKEKGLSEHMPLI